MTVLESKRRARTRRALRQLPSTALYDSRVVGLHGPTVRHVRKRFLDTYDDAWRPIAQSLCETLAKETP